MNQERFSRFEQRIEQLVEGSFARLFAGRLQPREVAMHLARAMEDNAKPQSDGRPLAPSIFTVWLNPQDYDALMIAHPELPQALADAVISVANHADMLLNTTPVVRLQADLTVPLRTLSVFANHEPDTRSTQVLEIVTAPPVHPTPHNPQLLIGGTRYIPLDRHVINIGRRQDNHIVIDDMRVSRYHAQIRLRFGAYVIYDLGSNAGTYINEHRITEYILKPGDVISLAGVPLVYIEDENITPTSLSDTAIDGQLPPRKDDDPTL
jgi:hypothetical protein